MQRVALGAVAWSCWHCPWVASSRRSRWIWSASAFLRCASASSCWCRRRASGRASASGCAKMSRGLCVEWSLESCSWLALSWGRLPWVRSSRRASRRASCRASSFRQASRREALPVGVRGIGLPPMCIWLVALGSGVASSVGVWVRRGWALLLVGVVLAASCLGRVPA